MMCVEVPKKGGSFQLRFNSLKGVWNKSHVWQVRKDNLSGSYLVVIIEDLLLFIKLGFFE